MPNTDRYQIIEKIGQGAVAEVYKAFDPQMKRSLAIKVMREDRCTNEDFRKRFLREAKAVGKLSHPNIVTIYDVGEMGDRPFIAMELLQGQFLDETLKAEKMLPWREVAKMGMQIASALDCAHQRGVVHRDIKPANIVRLATDNCIKLTDFGIAHMENLIDTQQTQIGEVLGTPLYMSPEQILGKSVDARSDLFSLGVVLYLMATGNNPFTGASYAALTYQIAHHTPKSLKECCPSISPGFEAIIMKLLEKQPDRRFQSATELLDEFTILLSTSTRHTHREGYNRRFKVAGLLTLLSITLIIVYLGLNWQSKNTSKSITHTVLPASEEIDNPLGQLVQVQNNLQGFACASLHATIDEQGGVLISGHISEDEMLILMDKIDNLTGINNITYAIEALKWPYCELLTLLSEFINNNINNQLGLSFNLYSHRNKFAEGAALVFDVTSPVYESYIYVDLYQPNGTVIHLLPNVNDNLVQIPPTENLTVGETGKLWKIGPPFGEHMIVVMASKNPIVNGLRERTEPAETYLSFLHQKIVNMNYQIVAEYKMLVTEPKI